MDTNLNNIDQFVKDYITAWSTKEDDLRKDLITKLYAPDADFYADEPGDSPVKRHGHDEIMQNITQVNVRLVQGKGLDTESTGSVVNHDMVKVAWKMTTPDGTVAITGMNILIRDSNDKIIRDYIFIG